MGWQAVSVWAPVSRELRQKSPSTGFSESSLGLPGCQNLQPVEKVPCTAGEPAVAASSSVLFTHPALVRLRTVSTRT